jgi:hypothetical protein
MLHKDELRPGYVYELAMKSGGIKPGIYCGRKGIFNKQYIFNVDKKIQHINDKDFAVIGCLNVYK